MKYCFAEACQNTFVLIDCLDQTAVDEKTFAEAHTLLKETGRDDVLILVGGRLVDNTYSAQMLVFGLDGALGEYCGNGARACASYLFANYPYSSFSLRTSTSSQKLARLGDNQFSVTLPPVSFTPNPKFIKPGTPLSPYIYVEAIEPHLVLHKNLSDAELLQLGQELNAKKETFPLGINVNACYITPTGALSVKTYERGVQRLTRSCGTGSISCAASLKRPGPIDVITPGGPLKVIVSQEGIELCGEGKYA